MPLPDVPETLVARPATPVTPPSAPVPQGVEWGAVTRTSLRFLGVMHAFRWASEPDTRAGGVGWGPGYLRGVGNLHGWADGDPFVVNYLGHPGQGAISGRIFLLHDMRYRRVEFGGSSQYWKSRLRGAAFSWAFSEQFEIGLLSEASIGQIQGRFPQQGFVDHVITPLLGTGLLVGEDALDRYAIRPLEDRVQNKWVRIALRTALNPTRSFATLVDGKAPWHRDTREGVLQYRPARDRDRTMAAASEPHAPIAPFEFSMASVWRQFPGTPCAGGGGEAAYRPAADWQLVLNVNGCKLLGLRQNVSGDALVYQVGPRWTPLAGGKWSPYVHVLLGGMKITQEEFFPEKKIQVEQANPVRDPLFSYRYHDQYTSRGEAGGLAFSAGTGVDYQLNAALAVRVAGVEYTRSSVGRLGGASYAGGFQLTSGMVLRLGTW